MRGMDTNKKTPARNGQGTASDSVIGLAVALLLASAGVALALMVWG